MGSVLSVMGDLLHSPWWPVLAVLAIVIGWSIVARVSYHWFRTLFPSRQGLERLDTAATRLAEEAGNMWSERLALLGWLPHLVIGAAVGLIIIPVVSFNVVILSDVFDFLIPGGGGTYTLNLPMVGQLQVGAFALLCAAIFVASQAALGVIMLHMAPHLLALDKPRLRVKELQKDGSGGPEPMGRGSRAVWLVAFILALAVGFEASMNALRTHVLTEGILLATVSSALIGIVVPSVESIASGFFWHAFVVPLLEYILPAIIAAFYSVGAAIASLLAYPPPERRQTPSCVTALNNMGADLNADFGRLERTIGAALNLPAVRENQAVLEGLTAILKRARNRGAD